MTFPVGKFGDQTMEFFPAPFRAPENAFAALVFAWQGDKVLLADIVGRGWCIPSGRVEPGEDSVQTAIREAQEEAGAIISAPTYIGCERMSGGDKIRWADVYVAEVGSLVEIGQPAESAGRRFVTIDELPAIYYLWNPLTEAVFAHSLAVLSRLRDKSAQH